MKKSYEEFIENLKGKSILFYGMGKSNIPFAEMLLKENINISIYDSKRNIEKLFNSDLVEYIPKEFDICKRYFDIIIRTPGVSFFSKDIEYAKQNGSIITSEMEIFFDLCPCTIIGITGSDGKTTTTTIISEILKHEKKVHLGGNIGAPLLPKIKEIKKTDVAVVELSSFQLMSMRRSPDIAIVLNISPNHLDVHKDINEYITSKKQILFHQTAFSRAILNFNNIETRKMQSDVRGKLSFFSINRKVKFGSWIDSEGNIIFSDRGKNMKIMNISEIKLPGAHNIENYLAAVSVTANMVKAESIIKTARNFNGVNHRIEFVREIDGVSYYNDSIASTPTRTINGTLSLFDKKIILIAGGYDKKIPFDSLAKKILERVSVLILMGNTAPKIKSEVLKLTKNNDYHLKIATVADMQEAVNVARMNSVNGDIVVLSPACASFDLYKDFEERGDHFKKLVNDLTAKR